MSFNDNAEPHKGFIHIMKVYTENDHYYHFNKPYQCKIPNIWKLSEKVNGDKDYKEALFKRVIEILTEKFSEIVFYNGSDKKFPITPKILANKGYMNYIESPRVMN